MSDVNALNERLCEILGVDLSGNNVERVVLVVGPGRSLPVVHVRYINIEMEQAMTTTKRFTLTPLPEKEHHAE
jgi:hypothetical protein